MDFVDEQQRLLSAGRKAVVGLGQDFAQLLHAAGDRADLLEMAAALLGQQPGQGGLARARRTVEDHRTEAVGRQQPAEQLPFAQEMLLPDELGERGGPHPRGQRLGPAAVGSSLASNSDMGLNLMPDPLSNGPPDGNSSRSGHAWHFGRALRQ